jgi:hypothetical protein
MQSIGVLILVSVADLSSAQEPDRVPREILDLWSYSIGSWKVEGQIGSTPVKGSATFEWADGKHCYIARQIWKIGDNERIVYLTLIGGWHAAAGETVEQGFSSSGSAATVHYRPAAENTSVLEGTIDGSESSGARWSGAINVERKETDAFQLTTTVDDAIVHSLKYIRTKGDGGARSESVNLQPLLKSSQTPLKQQPTIDRKKTAFNPLLLDNQWTRSLVGQWVGTGKSDAETGRGNARVELALNGQFLMFTGESEVTNISEDQRQYLKTQLHATDEEIERFRSMRIRGLELYTVDQETGDVLGYMFDSLRCIATGRGEWDCLASEFKWNRRG